MANRTYFFKHDYNARNDLKMKRLLKNYGAFGYGFYWYLVEMLHESESSSLSFTDDDLDMIADDLSFPLLIVTSELINETLEALYRYKLIAINDGVVVSKRVFKNKEKNVTITEIRKHIGSLGGKKKAENSKNVAIATESLPIANSNVAIATESLPIANSNVAIATENSQDQNSEKVLYQNKIYEAKTPSKNSEQTVGNTSAELANASKPSKQDTTTTTTTLKKEVFKETEISKNTNNIQAKSKKKSVDENYDIKRSYPVEEFIEIYFTDQKYSMVRERLALSKYMTMEDLRKKAEQFNEFLITTGEPIKQENDWAKHFKFWLDKNAQSNGNQKFSLKEEFRKIDAQQNGKNKMAPERGPEPGPDASPEDWEKWYYGKVH